MYKRMNVRNKILGALLAAVVMAGGASVAFGHPGEAIASGVPDSAQSAQAVAVVPAADNPITTVGKQAYEYRPELTSITLGEGLTSIGDYAFRGDYNLTEITIPASVESIGRNAFDGCWNLKTVKFADGSKLKSIGIFAFQYATGLETINLPKGLETIGQGAFLHTGLKSIEIPGTVKELPYQVFEASDQLTDVKLNDGVGRIAEYAFAYTGVEQDNLVVPSGTEVDAKAFDE